MSAVVALWRRMDDGGEWELVALFNAGSHFADVVQQKTKAAERISTDIKKWTLPVSYKISVELVEE